ncbi:hypothetical protein Tco_0793100 [Tanacetum coccineum]
MDEDKARQNAVAELAMKFDNESKAKDDMRKAYEKCNDISQETRYMLQKLDRVEEETRVGFYKATEIPWQSVSEHERAVPLEGLHVDDKAPLGESRRVMDQEVKLEAKRIPNRQGLMEPRES